MTASPSSGRADVTYVTRSQLERIHAQVQEPASSSQEDRARLKQLSDERASRWPNTLQAQRARKERARQERAAAEEAERIETDRREAELRAEQRRTQIERANKILFDETDRVRTFHSKLFQCDIIKENEALINFKKQMGVLTKAQEAAYVEQQRQAIELAEAAELRKLEDAKRRAVEQQAVQQQQLDALRERIIKERVEDKKEGTLLRQRALEEEEEMRKRDEARLARASS